MLKNYIYNFYIELPPAHSRCPSSHLPSAWVQREWVWVGESVCGSFKRNCLGLQHFFHWLNPHWFLQPEIVGLYLPGTGTLGWGDWYGAGTPWSWDIPPEFLSTTSGCGTTPFYACIPAASLDGCGFFNSAVVRLPLKIWQFWVMAVLRVVVIFMW